MTSFRLPDLGEGLVEAEIVEWHVAVGDRVQADQPLVSVETDKAVVEVPAPRAGRIAALHGAVGDMLAVGAPLVDFADGEGRPESVSVVGSLPEAPAPVRRMATRPTRVTAPPVPGVRAVPAVRALARQRGIALEHVRGSGPGGAITRADVEAGAAAPPEDYEPLRGSRRWMARAMSRAHAEVVPASVTEEADIDAWPLDMEPMPRLIRAMGVACGAEPALNAWYDAASESRRRHEQVDLGIAVDTDDGLVVPVLRSIATQSPDQLQSNLAVQRKKAEGRALTPEDVRGATITLSNFGSLAGLHAALVVVPPQVAIVGAGRAEPRVVARDGRPAVRRILPLSLTFDHRAVTGGEAARFLAALVADLEQAQ